MPAAGATMMGSTSVMARTDASQRLARARPPRRASRPSGVSTNATPTRRGAGPPNRNPWGATATGHAAPPWHLISES